MLSEEGEEEEEENGSGDLEDVLLPTQDLSLPSGVTVEPILFAIFFCTSLSSNVIINFLELKICEQQLPPSLYNCTEPFSPEVELKVQPAATKILMYSSLVTFIIPSILSFFIGPWSDTNGRKPFIIISLTGYTCFYMAWGILSVLPNVPVYYYVLPSICIALTGGTVAVFTCVNSYIGDISTVENRAFRFTVLTGSFMGGAVVGSLLSVELFKVLGPARYCGILFVSSFMCLLALVYSVFFIKETIQLRQSERQVFFNLQHMKSMMAVVFERRPGCGRGIIIQMAFILLFMVTVFEGEGSIKYLSLKESLSWRLEEYNFFSAASTLLCVVISIISITIMRKCFGMHNLTICLITVILWLISSILIPFSKTGCQFIVFSMIGSLSPLIGPTLRSEMSRIVPHSDIGKVFAFDCAIESFNSYMAVPMYTVVYNHVIKQMPLAVFFLSTGIISIILILNIIIIILEHYCGKPYYSVVEEEQNQPTSSQTVLS